MKNENSKKYTLFQAENGKWGTKTPSGKVHDKPEYERSVKEDGTEIFFNGIDTVCTFSEKEGMDLIAYGEPWWYVAYSLADYPKQYSEYLEKHFRDPVKTYPLILQSIENILSEYTLTEIQLHILDGIKQYMDCEINYPDTLDHDEEVYKEWIENSPSELTTQDCVDAILPLMQSPEIADTDKEFLWFGIFLFNDFINVM